MFGSKLKSAEWASAYQGPVDAVITWVDMHDEKWLQKYNQVIDGLEIESETYKNMKKEKINKARYESFQELWFSVESLKHFVPYLRKIYIVTDNQTPDFIDFSDDRVELIDHDQILGPECCRPTFKSTSIESYLYKIPELSEVFLVLNDDMSVGRKIKKGDLISLKTGIPWAEMTPKNLNFERVKPDHFQKKPWERHIFNAANLIKKRFGVLPNYTYTHQMTVVRKSCCAMAWELFHEELKLSVANPIRKPNFHTLSFIPLSQYLGILHGKMKLRNTTHISKLPHTRIFLGHTEMKNGEMAKRAFNTILHNRPHLICVNSVSKNNHKIYQDFCKKYFKMLQS